MLCTSLTPCRQGLIMDPVQCAGIFFFAEQLTEWIAVSNPSAGKQRFCNYVYMSALLCNIYAHVCTMRLYTSTGPVASLKLRL